MRHIRLVQCPRCHETCGWCSDPRWMHAVLPFPGTRQRCRVRGLEPEGANCPVCGGDRTVVATTTYARKPATSEVE